MLVLFCECNGVTNGITEHPKRVVIFRLHVHFTLEDDTKNYYSRTTDMLNVDYRTIFEKKTPKYKRCSERRDLIPATTLFCLGGGVVL